jgi:hypothetical protein
MFDIKSISETREHLNSAITEPTTYGSVTDFQMGCTGCDGRCSGTCDDSCDSTCYGCGNNG